MRRAIALAVSYNNAAAAHSYSEQRWGEKAALSRSKLVLRFSARALNRRSSECGARFDFASAVATPGMPVQFVPSSATRFASTVGRKTVKMAGFWKTSYLPLRACRRRRTAAR